MRSLRPYGKCLSSKMLKEVTDGGTVLRYKSNVCFIRSCTVKECNTKGNGLSCWGNYKNFLPSQKKHTNSSLEEAKNKNGMNNINTDCGSYLE